METQNPEPETTIAILCRTAVDLSPTATGEMMYMPGGLHTINPVAGGNKDKKPIRVLVNAIGAGELERQRVALEARGKRPFFDFAHRDEEASFWPAEFFWKDTPEPGIYCKGEWSSSGKSKVEGKEWRQFSPMFHVDNKRGNPARIVCQAAAKPNMGGLINDPAFHEISPLWAKDADGAQSITSNQTENTMIVKTLEALQAEKEALEQELSALKAKDAEEQKDALVVSEIRAREGELRATNAAIEIAALKAKNDTLEADDKARRVKSAKASVAAAVSRGAIAAKDDKTQAAWEKLITDDPGNEALLARQAGPAALGGRITPSSAVAARAGGRLEITSESARTLMTEFSALVCRNAGYRMGKNVDPEKSKLALQAGSFYRRELAPRMDDWQDVPFGEALQAADYADPNNQLGTLSGTLVLQRTLELFTYQYPELLSVFTDFSDAPALYNQTETTRILVKPAVQTYNPALGTDGRPIGWAVSSPAVSSDVPVTLNQHVGIPIVFGQDILAATARQLFSEVAPGATTALGGYFVDMLTALMTAANFPAYAANSFTGGATTSGSAACTCTSTVGMAVGQLITGAGIPAKARIGGIQSSTAFTLNVAATATASGLTFSTATSVPTTYATYVKAAADFNMASLDDIGSAFSNAEVPDQSRAIWLNTTYYARLSQDPNLALFYAALKSPEIISKGQLPELKNFIPFKAPFFPTANHGVGFAFHKASLVAKSRLPVDFTKALNTMVPGSITTVTDPATKLSAMLVEYVNLTQGYAEWRIEALLGAAVGDPRGGLLLASQ